MLNARVRVALRELNDKIKALLLLAPCFAGESIPCADTSTGPSGVPVPAVSQVTVILQGVGGRCSLALPALC
eukprot:12593653-Prorocentrum_lima.AAC.1